MISDKTKQEINRWIAKYPKGQQQSAVMEALKLVQADNNGYLTTKNIEEVAEFLQMPNINVAEVALFYENYNHQPVAKYQLRFCHNLPCMLNGADELIDYLDHKISAEGIDDLVEVKKVECLGACIDAPMCQIGDVYYQHLNREKIDKILHKLQKLD